MQPRFAAALLALAILGFPPQPGFSADDLTPLSDEFNNSSTLSDWSRIHAVEGWNADQLMTWDINTTQAGRMVLEPYTSSWYENFRGCLVFKEVTGDFVVTAEVFVTDRDPGDGNDVPLSQYSLAGLMIRTPRAITNPSVDWAPGGENYVFLSMGHGDNGGTAFQFEVKTTINSMSTLELTSNSANNAIVQIARIGGDVITLLRENSQPWVVHRRFDRADFPLTLQVGAVSYTDWLFIQPLDPYTQNSTVYSDLGATDPDIVAGYEYIRFARPDVPPSLVGQDLGPTGTVTDGDLLSFLGDNASMMAVNAWELH